MAANDWKRALALAARWHDLGEYKDVITRAHECYANARFYTQLGYNPDVEIERGKQALITRYGL